MKQTLGHLFAGAFRRIWVPLDRFRYRLVEASRHGRPVPPDYPEEVPPTLPVGKIALVGIAKNEDNYIDEWIDYHLRLGVDRVFLYQNDWRAHLGRSDPRVSLISFDGPRQQCPAFNDFLLNHAKGFDFGLFFDVDEYLCLADGRPLREFLAPFLAYAGVGLNWRLFGDSGRAGVENGDYSIVSRFTRCAAELNPHVKCIVNLRHLPDDFLFWSSHFVSRTRLPQRPGHLANVLMQNDCLVTPDRLHRIYGPFNTRSPAAQVWINHYAVKTMQEFVENRQRKGGGMSGPYVKPLERFYRANRNDSESLAAKEFYEASRRTHPVPPEA